MAVSLQSIAQMLSKCERVQCWWCAHSDHSSGCSSSRELAEAELPSRLALLGEELCSGRRQLLKCVFQVLSLGHSLNLEGEQVC